VINRTHSLKYDKWVSFDGDEKIVVSLAGDAGESAKMPSRKLSRTK